MPALDPQAATKRSTADFGEGPLAALLRLCSDFTP